MKIFKSSKAFSDKINRIISRKIFYVSSIVVFAVGLLACTLSLAYFQSKDEVTNKVEGKDIEILLLEPQWTDHGMTSAQTAEPGMTIDKDPQVYNKSDNSVYVRMSIDIVDKDGNSIKDTERYNAILCAIFCNSSTDTSKAFVETSYNQITASLNPNFEYSDGWFYYKTSNSEPYTQLATGETTPTLFDGIKIPALKSKYNGVFDSDYSINVKAQAIPVDTSKTLTKYEIRAEFESKYPSTQAQTQEE